MSLSLRRELGDADSVHARRPVVGPDLLPRLETRGAWRSQTTSPSAWVSSSAPPPQGWPRSDPGLPGPFAPAPLQDPHRYYEPVRPCAPHRYSAPHGCRRLGSSLSPAGRLNQPTCGRVGTGTTGSPVPCQRLRRAHATYTPGTARPARRPPPGSRHTTTIGRAFIPGTPDNPGFDAIVLFFRCVSSGSHTFVFSSHT